MPHDATISADTTPTRIAALEARIAELEGRSSPDPEPRVDRSVSRRRLIGMAGAAAAGAVGTTLVSAAPAGADGTAVLIGVFNTGTLGTTLESGAGATFQGNNTAAVNGSGLRGFTSGAGFGVRGTATGAGGMGVFAEAPDATASYPLLVAAPLSQATAHVRLTPHASVAGAPASGTHQPGELWVGSTGELFLCTAAGTPGTWTKLNNQAGSGGLTTLPAPFRVYDSRVGQANPSGSPQGPLAFGAAARTINCSPTTPALPAGATTLLFNLTVAGSAGPSAGALLVWAAGAPEPLASSINWSGPGQVVANGVTSVCDASQDVQVKCVASAGSSTQFLLDVVGYYL